MGFPDANELAEGLPIWEQQPGEDDREYQLFVLYASAGPLRSVKTVVSAWNASRGEGVTEAQVIGMMRRWRWIQRAGSFVQTTGVALATLRQEMLVQLSAELFAESTRVRKMILAVLDRAELDKMEPEQIRRQLAALMQMYRQMGELTLEVLAMLRQNAAGDAPEVASGGDLVDRLLKQAYEAKAARVLADGGVVPSVEAQASAEQQEGENWPWSRTVTVNGVIMFVGDDSAGVSPVLPT